MLPYLIALLTYLLSLLNNNPKLKTTRVYYLSFSGTESMALLGPYCTVSHLAAIKVFVRDLQACLKRRSSCGCLQHSVGPRVLVTLWWLARDCSQFLGHVDISKWKFASSWCGNQGSNRESLLSKAEVKIFCNRVTDIASTYLYYCQKQVTQGERTQGWEYQVVGAIFKDSNHIQFV